MGRRDDRLRDPEVFRAVLMSRPVARSGPFWLYRAPSLSGRRLGFVIPKKLVKTAVQRNQIKRWARDLFRSVNATTTLSESWVLRVVGPLSKKTWIHFGKTQSKHNLLQVMGNTAHK